MRLATILFSAVLSGYGPAALAQSTADYPHRAIRIVVPLAAGGNVDIVARTLADQVSKSLGQAVLVGNGRAQSERLARGVHRAHQGGIREERPARARRRHQTRVAR
jgi:hypothetical protein